jgi:cytochrome c oxidase subunit 2
MKREFRRTASLFMLLPFVAAAASPAQSEYQAALGAKPDFEHGAELFTQCVACHGAEGLGLPDGSTPKIAGQHFRVLVKQLVDFRYGKRWDPRMEQRANSHLGAFKDIADVSSYLSQQPGKSQRNAPERNLDETGAALYSASCASCHGAEGEGNDAGAVPLLAGQHPEYVLRQLQSAVDGRGPALKQLHGPRVKGLDADQLRAISNYLSNLGSTD